MEPHVFGTMPRYKKRKALPPRRVRMVSLKYRGISPKTEKRYRAQERPHAAAGFAGAVLALLCALRERVVCSHAAVVCALRA